MITEKKFGKGVLDSVFCFIKENVDYEELVIKTADKKLSAFMRVAPFMTDFNKKVISNFFLKGQFNYCPLF